MTSHNPPVEVLSGPERRRRWSTAEKLAISKRSAEQFDGKAFKYGGSKHSVVAAKVPCGMGQTAVHWV
jgi:hypothetical protein